MNKNSRKATKIGVLKMTIQTILKLMIKKGASDLHLKAGSKPIIRKNQNLYLLDEALPSLNEEDIQQLITPLLTPELLAVYKKNKNIDFGRYFENIGRLRFCIFSQKGTTRVVARSIPDFIKTFEELNIPKSIEKLGSCKSGLILITGATGSGKSTTAASFLNYINKNYSYHIITIEDPIEYVLHDQKSCISQRENLMDFNNPKQAFKGALRQDPDVIFFGELRDVETMSTALQAAESGHLVISTLHTSSAIETFSRILSFFKESSNYRILKNQLIHSLRAIIGQKLIPIKEGVIPAVEIFLNNLSMKEALLKEKSFHEIHEMIEKSKKHWGMQSFDQHIVELIQTNVIPLEVGLRYAISPSNIELHCKGIKASNSSFYKIQNKPIEQDSKLQSLETLRVQKDYYTS